MLHNWFLPDKNYFASFFTASPHFVFMVFASDDPPPDKRLASRYCADGGALKYFNKPVFVQLLFACTGTWNNYHHPCQKIERSRKRERDAKKKRERGGERMSESWSKEMTAISHSWHLCLITSSRYVCEGTCEACLKHARICATWQWWLPYGDHELGLESKKQNRNRKEDKRRHNCKRLTTSSVVTERHDHKCCF